MFQWRWKLRQAKQAIDDGRYDEASRLLADQELREFLPAKQLADQLAAKLASRAGERIAAGRSQAGFTDLAIAEQLGERRTRVGEVRGDYAERVAADATRRIIAGSYEAASDAIARANRRGVNDENLRLLDEVATLCQAAAKSANEGEMSLAETSVTQAVRLLEMPSHPNDNVTALREALQQHSESLATRSRDHATARTRMQQAVAAENWADALAAVEEAIRFAPYDSQALRVRRQAWKKLGLETTRAYHGRKPSAPQGNRPARGRAIAQAVGQALRHSTHHHRQVEDDTVSGRAPVNRRMLWIDSVGALLVCLDDQIVLGQPTGDPARGPAVPILADLSRRHAVIRREAGRYVLEPLGKVQIDGREVSETTVLPDQCLLELGEGVRFQFDKPHALSATARLTPASGHRLSPPADAVLLMADSCVLGPAAHCHVRCRDWTDDVVLYRQEGELSCRSKEPLLVDGVECSGAVTLAGNPRIEGQEFAFTVEDPDAAEG